MMKSPAELQQELREILEEYESGSRDWEATGHRAGSLVARAIQLDLLRIDSATRRDLDDALENMLPHQRGTKLSGYYSPETHVFIRLVHRLATDCDEELPRNFEKHADQYIRDGVPQIIELLGDESNDPLGQSDARGLRPLELADQLDISERSLSKYASELGILKPKRGERHFFYSHDDAVKIAKRALESPESRIRQVADLWLQKIDPDRN